LSVKDDAPAWAARLQGLLLPTGTVRIAAHGPVPALPGYDEGAWWVQDAAASIPAKLFGEVAGLNVADLCAAPGGKATGMASAAPRLVVAGDVSAVRAGLIAANARALGAERVAIVVADGRAPALRPGVSDRVLVDAPCSGLGVLRRRPDARWRMTASDVAHLAALQRALLAAAATLVRPGGVLAYSVCTLTSAETLDVDGWAADALPAFQPLEVGVPWRAWGRGGLLLPQEAGTDGMFLLLLRRQA
jgi:16S rRNA (cytosine967-C5)-methyltransferase